MKRTQTACEKTRAPDCRTQTGLHKGVWHRYCALLVLIAGLWILCPVGSRATPVSRADAERHIREGIKWFTNAKSGEEFEKAVIAFQKAVKAGRDYIPAHVWLGVAYVESDRSEERVRDAINEFEKALAIPDRQNKYEGYLGLARRRLLRLRGRPQAIALSLDAGSDRKRKEAGDLALEGVRASLTSRGYRVLTPGALGLGENWSEASLYAKGRSKAMGWIALITINEFQEPSLTTDRDRKRHWSASARATVQILDCEMRRKLPAFAASAFQYVEASRTSSQDALHSLTDGLGKTVAEKVLDIVAREDEIVKEGCGIRSVRTDIPMLFAETSVRDRKQARQMEIIVFPLPKQETGSLEPEESYAASLTVRQTIRKTILNDGKYALVSFIELEKLKARPVDWTPEKAALFARKVGKNCRAVLITRITRSEATAGQSLGRATVHATVELEATVVSRDAATTSTSASVSDKRSYWLTNKDNVAEKKQKMLITVAEKAAKELCDKVQAIK